MTEEIIVYADGSTPADYVEAEAYIEREEIASMYEDRHEGEIEAVIVTRHSGLVEWLGRHGIIGKVITHATSADVTGKNVIGALPFHLAALAESVSVVDLPNLPEGKRGHELTAAEMDECGAILVTYTVTRIDN